MDWVITVEKVDVTSPQWDENDQTARQWKGKESGGNVCYFTIEDAEFWIKARRNELRVEVPDKLTVQWAYQIADGKPKNRRVLRVLELNGKNLADRLSDNAISAILGSFSQKEVPNAQKDLFG